MGGIWTDREQLQEFLIELVGTKLGLAISNRDVEPALDDTLGTAPPGALRVRSEQIEQLSYACLQRFGDPDAGHVRSSPTISLAVLHSYAYFPATSQVMAHVISRMGQLLDEQSATALDPTVLLMEVETRWGGTGVEIALRVLQELNARVVVSPWSRAVRTEYPSREALRNLFESRELPLPLELFFDQRFVDYLDANGNDIREMHWRQFEGLVAEALARTGMRVELGPGSNDDGIDVRAWAPGQGEDAPALVLVQCKREQRRVGRVVVKAMAADVAFEGAQVGLVATTSSWSPAARETVYTRKYPIAEVNGQRIHEWLAAMRTPGAGPWLAN
ncbi:unannotated protein [freshwater metagenome]|uniref:Unannotated protein n=1 Tax=freshwater metagenome TaxID=449393 RepID=A0A6J7HW24_9ZZZZ|nr:hypothetical protein [Actinomycetota bacterium]